MRWYPWRPGKGDGSSEAAVQGVVSTQCGLYEYRFSGRAVSSKPGQCSKRYQRSIFRLLFRSDQEELFVEKDPINSTFSRVFTS